VTPEQYARVKELFLEALSAADRGDFLDRAVSDPAIRHEVEDLLQHDRPETILTPDAHRAYDETVGRTRGSGTLFQPRELAAAVSQLFTLSSHQVARAWLLAILLFLVIVALLASWLWIRMGAAMRTLEREQLQALLHADVRALTSRLESEKEKVDSWLRDPDVIEGVRELARLGPEPNLQTLLRAAPQQAAVRAALVKAATEPQDKESPHVVYGIWNPSFVLIADSTPDGAALGERATEQGAVLLTRVFAGKTILMTPHFPQQISAGFPKLEQPIMGIAAPIRDDDARVIAAAIVRGIELESTFFELLAQSRTGTTGETFAFNRAGVMISPSHFEDDLRKLGLIPAETTSGCVLNVQLRDPGKDLTRGSKTNRPLAAQPLTRMAASATQGEAGVDVDGYRDFRGRWVVGAWQWLPEYDFGVATEIDYDEAFAPLRYIRNSFATLAALALAALAGIVVTATMLLRRRNLEGALGHVGPYLLEEKIGEGGMGRVYRARHQLLVRPTAVKVLKPNIADATTIKRFHREVTLASRLRHPHTIAIYDYGHTDEGVFYYAMEYLDGLNLAELIKIQGCVPPERVVFLLKQVCASLREAHELGLVHRDIKPQNIMTCPLGGEFDFVKVLDFGLVKQSDDPHSTVLAGTPRYMAPERFLNPKGADPRSDVYSLGAVAYNLLTGADLFPGEESESLLYHLVNTVPERPTAVVRAHIPEALDQLVVDCLAKDPNSRPQSMADVLQRLEGIKCVNVWTSDDARRWWQQETSRVQAALTARSHEALPV